LFQVIIPGLFPGGGLPRVSEVGRHQKRVRVLSPLIKTLIDLIAFDKPVFVLPLSSSGRFDLHVVSLSPSNQIGTKNCPIA
jgi:hypothetical protein